MKHRYSSGMFCQICGGSVGEDDDSSVGYCVIFKNTFLQSNYSGFFSIKFLMFNVITLHRAYCITSSSSPTALKGGHGQLKVHSFFSSRIAKNLINNYASTLIIR